MSEKRVFSVNYKAVFEGCVGPYEVDKKEGPTEIRSQIEAYWEEIKRNIHKMEFSDWNLDAFCERCGGLVYLDDDGNATFECDCTTESPDTY
jgi:hypothetical protein